MNMLALADLANMTESQVAADLEQEFDAHNALFGCEVVIAYKSVGSWGCDSDAFVVFRRDGVLYEVNGSHCSCYGFEGQWEPEEVTDVEAICQRADYCLAGGGYDDDAAANAEAIRNHLRQLQS